MIFLEPIDSVLKTVGFSLVEMKYHGFKITIYDLGGSSSIRDIWNKYYMDVSYFFLSGNVVLHQYLQRIRYLQAHGLIYVVDASDSFRFEESKRIFADLLSHENITGKHILLFVRHRSHLGDQI